MNITADNLESTLNYILELIIILYIQKNILLIPLAGAKKRYIALALSSAWLLYTLLAAFPLPNTFIILPVSLLVFARNQYNSFNQLLLLLYDQPYQIQQFITRI
mgnify:CR=1 FL=1